MPRAPKDAGLQSRAARLALKPPKTPTEPHWRNIGEGLFLGYRRTARGSAWICRKREGARYKEQRIGTPDDYLNADGVVVYTYHQAIELARGVAAASVQPAPRHHGAGFTLNDCWTLYSEQHLASKASLDSAAGFWRLHVKDAIGPRLVSTLTADDYRAWLRALALKPPTKRGKVLAFDPKDSAARVSRAASANRVWTIVKAALTFTRRAGKLDADRAPWLDVKPIRIAEADEAPPRMLERDEITRLLNACPADLRALATGALMTGARYGELSKMRVRDFDAETERVTIRQTKSGKRLYQPLTPEGVAFFERHTAGRAPDETMFQREGGAEWTKSAQHRPIKAAAATAKVKGVSFKVTRATYGKLLLLATKDIELVAKALGHSDSRITRKHYAQLLPSEIAAGIAQMPALGLKVDGKVRRIGKVTRPRGSGA